MVFFLIFFHTLLAKIKTPPPGDFRKFLDANFVFTKILLITDENRFLGVGFFRFDLRLA